MAIEGMEGVVEIKKDVFFTPDQLDMIEHNPAGLTKEGVLKEIDNWKRSGNLYQLRAYERMLKLCTKLQPSGRTVDGRNILAKKDGKVTWAD
jgi:hypothetical protein